MGTGECDFSVQVGFRLGGEVSGARNEHHRG